MAGISIWQLLIVLAIIVMVFGTRRLRGMGADTGVAIRDFKQSMAASKADEATASTKKRSDVG